MKKLAIICSHPIQYNAPLFRLLSQRSKIDVKVFYTWGLAANEKYDPGFNKIIEWDIPLLEGYEYEFCENISPEPGSHHYKGINNPFLIQSVLKYEATHLLVFGWNFKSHLKLMRYFKGKIPVLFRGDSTLLNESSGFSFKKLARKLFLRWVYRNVDVALFVGTANEAYYKNAGLKEEQLVFAPHAIDNNYFSDKIDKYAVEATAWRQTLDIKTNEIVFLFAGKFEETKNLVSLIHSFKEINLPSVRLVLVGNGPQEVILKDLAFKDSRIVFLPFQNQSKMPVVYRLGDVYVLPSLGETWGLAVNEAMACARPVLVSNRCGCAADLVKDVVNGYIFDALSQNDLIEKIKLMATNKNRLPEMGAEASQFIQQWSFEEISKSIEKVVYQT